MYGIILCPGCGRKRIIDLRNKVSVCPYCNHSSHIEKMTVLFSDKDQSVVRKVFENADASEYPAAKKRGADDPDPLSTLVFEYEHTSGTLEKLTVLASGLTKIYGEFTEDDVNENFPGDAEQMIRMMISQGIIIESSCGRYKAI
jgi:hypothetical protein